MFTLPCVSTAAGRVRGYAPFFLTIRCLLRSELFQDIRNGVQAAHRRRANGRRQRGLGVAPTAIRAGKGETIVQEVRVRGARGPTGDVVAAREGSGPVPPIGSFVRLGI